MSENKGQDNASLLSLSDILSKDDSRYVEIYIEELGGKVRLRNLTAKETIDFNESLESKTTAKQAMLRLAALCMVNPDNTPMFPELRGMDRLSKMNVRVLMKIQDAALTHNDMLTPLQIRMMTEKDAAKEDAKRRAKERYDRAKNDSSEVNSEDSPFASPSSSEELM